MTSLDTAASLTTPAPAAASNLAAAVMDSPIHRNHNDAGDISVPSALVDEQQQQEEGGGEPVDMLTVLARGTSPFVHPESLSVSLHRLGETLPRRRSSTPMLAATPAVPGIRSALPLERGSRPATPTTPHRLHNGDVAARLRALSRGGSRADSPIKANEYDCVAAAAVVVASPDSLLPEALRRSHSRNTPSAAAAISAGEKKDSAAAATGAVPVPGRPPLSRPSTRASQHEGIEVDLGDDGEQQLLQQQPSVELNEEEEEEEQGVGSKGTSSANLIAAANVSPLHSSHHLTHPELEQGNFVVMEAFHSVSSQSSARRGSRPVTPEALGGDTNVARAYPSNAAMQSRNCIVLEASQTVSSKYDGDDEEVAEKPKEEEDTIGADPDDEVARILAGQDVYPTKEPHPIITRNTTVKEKSKESPITAVYPTEVSEESKNPSTHNAVTSSHHHQHHRGHRCKKHIIRAALSTPAVETVTTVTRPLTGDRGAGKAADVAVIVESSALTAPAVDTVVPITRSLTAQKRSLCKSISFNLIAVPTAETVTAFTRPLTANPDQTQSPVAPTMLAEAQQPSLKPIDAAMVRYPSKQGFIVSGESPHAFEQQVTHLRQEECEPMVPVCERAPTRVVSFHEHDYFLLRDPDTSSCDCSCCDESDCDEVEDCVECRAIAEIQHVRSATYLQGGDVDISAVSSQRVSMAEHSMSTFMGGASQGLASVEERHESPHALGGVQESMVMSRHGMMEELEGDPALMEALPEQVQRQTYQIGDPTIGSGVLSSRHCSMHESHTFACYPMEDGPVVQREVDQLLGQHRESLQPSHSMCLQESACQSLVLHDCAAERASSIPLESSPSRNLGTAGETAAATEIALVENKEVPHVEVLSSAYERPSSELVSTVMKRNPRGDNSVSVHQPLADIDNKNSRTPATAASRKGKSDRARGEELTPWLIEENEDDFYLHGDGMSGAHGGERHGHKRKPVMKRPAPPPTCRQSTSQPQLKDIYCPPHISRTSSAVAVRSAAPSAGGSRRPKTTEQRVRTDHPCVPLPPLPPAVRCKRPTESSNSANTSWQQQRCKSRSQRRSKQQFSNTVDSYRGGYFKNLRDDGNHNRTMPPILPYSTYQASSGAGSSANGGFADSTDCTYRYCDMNTGMMMLHRRGVAKDIPLDSYNDTLTDSQGGTTMMTTHRSRNSSRRGQRMGRNSGKKGGKDEQIGWLVTAGSSEQRGGAQSGEASNVSGNSSGRRRRGDSKDASEKQKQLQGIPQLKPSALARQSSLDIGVLNYASTRSSPFVVGSAAKLDGYRDGAVVGGGTRRADGEFASLERGDRGLYDALSESASVASSCSVLVYNGREYYHRRVLEAMLAENSEKKKNSNNEAAKRNEQQQQESEMDDYYSFQRHEEGGSLERDEGEQGNILQRVGNVRQAAVTTDAHVASAVPCEHDAFQDEI